MIRAGSQLFPVGLLMGCFCENEHNGRESPQTNVLRIHKTVIIYSTARVYCFPWGIDILHSTPLLFSLNKLTIAILWNTRIRMDLVDIKLRPISPPTSRRFSSASSGDAIIECALHMSTISFLSIEVKKHNIYIIIHSFYHGFIDLLFMLLGNSTYKIFIRVINQ